ncbi:small-conductance mechanosensitive channel [Pedobacter sp. UYP30]|uniref:hypothetical protein n=1 Tax=Pedobacter sp. UYP30 TaxID=1756400 RepID=UPI003397CEC6
MSTSIIDTLLGIIGIIAQLLIFIASMYFLVKCKGTEAILLTIGSAFSLIMSIFYRVISYLVSSGSITGENTTSMYSIAGFFSTIFYVIFAVGFFMLLFKLANQPKQDFSQFPPTNY